MNTHPDVFVHVGPHKTGSTFIQQVLAYNRVAMKADGVLVPGRSYYAQRMAAMDVLAKPRSGPDGLPPKSWLRVANSARSWHGPSAVISVERFDDASRRVKRVIAESLAPARVHIVYTARDFTQVVPAMWQTQVRNGRAVQSWQEYLTAIREQHDRSKWPWHLAAQDPSLVLTDWERFVPADRIHVITVPRPGVDRAVLWGRFCSVVGLEADRYTLDVARANISLGAAEIRFLQQLNRGGATEIRRQVYQRWVQRHIDRIILEQRADQRRYALSAGDYTWARGEALDFVDFLRAGRYPVTGDLDELVPPADEPPYPSPDEVTDREVLDVAVSVVAGLLSAIEQGANRPVLPSPGQLTRLVRRRQDALARRWTTLRRRQPDRRHR